MFILFITIFLYDYNSIFLDKSGAFYRFGEVLYLKELNKEDVYQYLVENFPNLGDNKMGYIS